MGGDSHRTNGDANAKASVYAFWDAQSCGEAYLAGSTAAKRFEAQRRARYELEGCIPEFACFSQAVGRDVLEIGVGMGADHVEWARAQPRSLVGVDLTPRAVEFTRRRLELAGYPSRLSVADAENLPFDADSFDIVFSWGVLHHTPDTGRAIREVHRVLRTGGQAKIMLYHRWSLTGAMLWFRYAVLRGRPLLRLDTIYARHLESPGTRAYSKREAAALFGGFRTADLRVELSAGDLLLGKAGQRHQGWLLDVARRVWPRSIIRRWAGRFGLFLLVTARK